ncbi:unnamed protein product [Pleuronectes platessa]|uniref:Uncharacterized protein n=1 Tax=Pleuronectes platessa TaxID=8262 RepID=A0A9N7V728_PLEPL|nr:unnamed protein product [Pleuronectes platessa]
MSETARNTWHTERSGCAKMESREGERKRSESEGQRQGEKDALERMQLTLSWAAFYSEMQREEEQQRLGKIGERGRERERGVCDVLCMLLTLDWFELVQSGTF